jgi:gamma-glutamyltranspeptidase / glutathione hydrolase
MPSPRNSNWLAPKSANYPCANRRTTLSFARALLAGILTATVALGLSAPFVAQAVPAQGHRIMVAGPSPDSIKIVKRIHNEGGNVVDAAVATAFGLAVTHPYYAALGGGGFALVKMGKEKTALDFREMAPASANPKTYVDKPGKASLDGGLAVGVPGITAGLYDLHKKFGKLKWAAVVTPAIELAEKGFEVSGEWVFLTARNQKRFNEPGQKIFFTAKGEALKPGDLFKQPALAKLLKRIRTEGASAFYKGANAKDVVEVVNATGGSFTTNDLANYKTRWLEPLTANFMGYQLTLMPPPSSGGVVIAQAVRLLEKIELAKKTEPLSADEYHGMIEVERLSFRNRSSLGDPDFTKNPIAELTSEDALDKLAKQIDMKKALQSAKFLSDEERKAIENARQEKEQTTHFSVMDEAGNTVAMTVTLNGDYGSALVTNSGVALNNEMDDFTTRPRQPNMFGLIQGEANSVRAGARPLSSMSPSIVEKDGETVLSVGSPGGPRIITGVLQTIYRVLARNMNIDKAIQAPRVHHQFLPDVVNIDADRFAPETVNALKSKGHTLQTGSTAKVYGVSRANGLLEAGADARGEGAAGGF